MILNLPDKIVNIARSLPVPLYVVGGFVRNFIIDGSYSEDIDVCAPLTVDELLPYLEKFGVQVLAVYKRTGTILFSADKIKYEFTSFRKDEYEEGGAHTPDKTLFTTDITDDAKRRDFKCNAVYYDIAGDKIIDVLDGIADIKNKRLDTVVCPRRVFSHDGLRLMRLARFSAELGFTPTAEVMASAKENAENIKDISVERIYEELKRILASDTKYPFSDKRGHYIGLKILDDIRALDYILPELTKGRGMAQKKQYHKYDVLEHSLRACLYSPPRLRLIGLTHDIAKPYCMITNGRYRGHAEIGAELVEGTLKRLKADNKTIKKAKFLVGAHMLDLNGDMPESQVRIFIVRNYPLIEDLLLLKQADRSAYKDDLTPSQVVLRWRKILADIKIDGTPMRVKDLKITPDELVSLGVKKTSIGKALDRLWDLAIENPSLNQNKELTALVKTLLD